MNCRDAEEILSAYLDGQLSDSERDSLEDHLKQCENCRESLREISLIKDALSSLQEVPVPEGLHDRIMAAARAHATEIQKCASESMGGSANNTFESDGISGNVGDLAPGSDAPLQRRKSGLLSGLVERFSNMSARQWVPLTAAAMVLVMFLLVGGTLFFANKGFQLGGLSAPMATEQAGELGFASPGEPSPGMVGTENILKSAPRSFGVATSPDMLATEVQANDAAAGRKIIRRAQVSVEVSRGKIRETAELAESIVATHFGYVEQSSMSGNVDKELTNYYLVARVPVDGVDKAVDELSALGRVTKEDTSSQDITDQYIDLDARLRNKSNQESRLLEIMGEAKTVGELLQVEGELSRVRGDIESMQAQINSYDKMTALASVSFSAAEEGSIGKPPSPWNEVWRAFVRAWRNLLMFTAQAAPTLILLGVLVWGGVWLVRRSAKRT